MVGREAQQSKKKLGQVLLFILGLCDMKPCLPPSTVISNDMITPEKGYKSRGQSPYLIPFPVLQSKLGRFLTKWLVVLGQLLISFS